MDKLFIGFSPKPLAPEMDEEELVQRAKDLLLDHGYESGDFTEREWGRDKNGDYVNGYLEVADNFHADLENDLSIELDSPYVSVYAEWN